MSAHREGNANIQVEITDAREFHCFKLVLNPEGPPFNPLEPTKTAPRIEIMLHARSLVDLIHKCNEALCDWQKQTTDYLLDRIYKVTPEDVIALGKAENPEGYR